MNTAPPRLVSEIMTRNIVTLFEEDSLQSIPGAMDRFGFHHVPVVDDGKLVGLVTHRDFLRLSASRLAPMAEAHDANVRQSLFVRDVMTTTPTTVRPETMIVDAARIMLAQRIGCLPVVDAEGRLVGIVTETDMLALTVQLLEHPPRA